MNITFRPLPTWPHQPTKNRPYARFDTPYPRTVALLMREVEMLGGREITLGIGLSETDIRLDGQPRANARTMSHPGVEVSFDAKKYGRLAYATDMFADWQDNVRAVALSLEALRAVERWGVSKGRQYTGFALLSAGPGMEERGRQIVDAEGNIGAALRATHPDTGRAEYTTSDYQAVIAYRKTRQADEA